MAKKPRTIPEMVRVYAEKWRDQLLPDPNRPFEKGPLERFVHEYMSERFGNALDALMGVDRGWNQIELKMGTEKQPTIAAQLIQHAEPMLMRLGKELFESTPFVVSERERTRLRKLYRERLLHELRDKVSELAQKRALEISERELDGYMENDEWIALVEGRVIGKKEKDVAG